MIKRNVEIDEISGRKFDQRVAMRLLPYLRPHLGEFVLATCMVIVSASIALYAPRLLGRIVDEGLLPKNQELLYRLVALYAGLELVRLICVYGQSFRLLRVGQSVMQAIRRDLFARLLRMPVPFFDRNPVGKLVTRMTNDTVNLSELFSSGFILLLSDILLMGGVMVSMLLLHWKLGLAAICVFPIMIFIIVKFSASLRTSFRASRDVLSHLNAFFAERMQGMSLVQLMEREEHERKHYTEISKDFRQKQFDGVFLQSLFHPALTILTASSIALVLWFGPGYLEKGEIPLGTFVAFLSYVIVLYQPVRSITDRYNIYLAAMASAERIFTLMDMDEEEGVRAKSNTRATSGMGALEFRDVSFYYPSSRTSEAPRPALEKVSFTIQEGETVALVGHTGAGKTTVTNLLFRFYEPSEGKIFLGGTDLAQIPKRDLRERIGFVQQEVFLFSGTLRENLVLLHRDLTDEQILEGCARTGFLRVVEKLPKGLDTELDERGANLSLGERQILAFTRVYLQKPELLVLDEASSSVDRGSEILLQNAARELTKGRSALVIAHRLETVRDADRILVLEHGHLVEQGNHESLVREGGRYAKFVKLQEAHSPS